MNNIEIRDEVNVSCFLQLDLPMIEHKSYHVSKKCSYCGGTYSSSEMAGSDICVYCADNLGR